MAKLRAQNEPKARCFREGYTRLPLISQKEFYILPDSVLFLPVDLGGTLTFRAITAIL